MLELHSSVSKGDIVRVRSAKLDEAMNQFDSQGNVFASAPKGEPDKKINSLDQLAEINRRHQLKESG